MAFATSSFWGPVTSTTEWCEQNYVYSSYIAEFYNTISNIPSIVLSLFGLVITLSQRFEKRFSILHVSNMILAIGSMLFHATLQRLGGKMDGRAGWVTGYIRYLLVLVRQQQGDETPMVWEMLLYIYILYSPDWHYKSTMPTFLFLYGLFFAIFHSQIRFDIGFKVHYIMLCLLCIPRMYKYYIHTQDKPAKRLAKRYIITLLLALLCWLSDRLFCKNISLWYFNPQGHALWHSFMAFNSYFANQFLMFCRAQQRGWNPRIEHFMGFFPYVKIEKPKSQ